MVNGGPSPLLPTCRQNVESRGAIIYILLLFFKFFYFAIILLKAGCSEW